ncbi:hypothetical protein ACMAZF_01355 [Psychrobium sp. nBUS_13]|uniref:hypothetical protein n=1 Tax=Psychrobium sp. nBUS_13 TaxID=3395319 RepID=UPI003EB86006
MTDFAKTVVAILISTVISASVVVGTLSADIASVKTDVSRIDIKIESFDKRLREQERQGAVLVTRLEMRHE